MEGAPFILLGTMVSGFIDVYMPSGMLEKALPKRKLPAILVCGFLGIILPVCECAVVPVIRRLVAKGLPVSCAFTYMLAAPIVNPITILSTWSAFNDQQSLYITLSRIGIGYLVSVVVGIIVMWVPIEKVLRKSLIASISTRSAEKQDCCSDVHQHDTCASHQDSQTHRHHHTHSHAPEEAHACCDHQHSSGCSDAAQSHQHSHTHAHENAVVVSGNGLRVVSAMRSGMKDFVDVAVYFTIGVCLTALFNIMQVDYYETINSYAGDPYAGTAMLMTLAFVLSVCSTSDAFLAASLGSFSYASKMAFMVFGPMLDVKLLFLYQTVMRKRFLMIFCVGLFFGVGGVCILWERADWLFDWCQGIEAKFLSEGGNQ